MKQLLLIPIVLCAFVLGAAPAVAGPPTNAEGDWTYVPTITDIRQAGPNQFFYGTDTGTFTGTFEGTSTETFVVVCHPSGGFNSYNGTIEFTGSVEGRSGTMIVKTNGKQQADTCLPDPANTWFGRWVIIGGTGGLADLHGNGVFNGGGFDLDYSGQIHFD